MNRALSSLLASASVFTAMALAGCGTPGAPLPPSLRLPERVADLTATRTGGQVRLHWSMPHRTTDKLPLKGLVTVRLRRCEGTQSCQWIGTPLKLAPDAASEFMDALTSPLAAGRPRPINYSVELLNDSGRSSGPSNEAFTLAGEAPASVDALTSEVRRSGVVLRWNSGHAAPTFLRIHRRLTSMPAVHESAGPLPTAAESAEQSLLVAPSDQPGVALDPSARIGSTYEYTVQRVLRVEVSGQTLELSGEPSSPLKVEALVTTPPDPPQGLAAVATVAAGSMGIDLSWMPNAESDLVGYAIYRREGESEWKRVSPELPLATPVYRDAVVQSGHVYHYTVTAFDRQGHESARSQAATESVP